MNKALLALAAVMLASPGLANTLIHNANGIQVGPDGKLQRFESLLIGDDGKVIGTFTKVQDPAHEGPRIDAEGRTIRLTVDLQQDFADLPLLREDRAVDVEPDKIEVLSEHAVAQRRLELVESLVPPKKI